MQYYSYVMAHVVWAIHQLLIWSNAVSIPFVIINEPFYIWVPIVSVLVSPVLGSIFCIFNQLEDFYRAKAGLPQKDRGL